MGGAGDRRFLRGVQAGRVAPLTAREADALPPVPSAIVKRPLAGIVAVGPLGVAGDEQADPSVHGGIEKAVYAYLSEHYEFWRELLGVPHLPFGALGENLTLEGLVESDVWIGDELHVGSCVLAVAGPRRPCEKLNRHLSCPVAGREMVRRGLTGWYLRVDVAGGLQTGDAVRLVPGPRSVSLTERQRKMLRSADLR